MTNPDERKLRRAYPSALARALWALPVYLIFVPLTRVLQVLGIWPRLMARSTNRMFDEVEPFTPGPNDVLVCSYFKSGTNWTMQIAAQIAYRGAGDFDHIHDVVPWLELPDKMPFAVSIKNERVQHAAPTDLRVIKTHMPASKLHLTEQAKYIWVVRDPKDVFVSGYRFIHSVLLGPLMPSVDHWLDNFVSEESYWGSWAAHLDGGWRQRDQQNVLFLTYEDMRTDLPGTVRKIAELMAVDLTEAEFERVVERSSYPYMKAHSRQFDTRGLSPPWTRPEGKMIRRGEQGSASELLSDSDRQRVDDFWRGQLAELGSNFPYDAHYGGDR